MLEIQLDWAIEPEMMQEHPCGMCGGVFTPSAVLASINVSGQWIHESVLGHDCLRHLAHRADTEDIPATWNQAYADYLVAEQKYPEPKYASVQAVMAAERAAGEFSPDIYDGRIRR